MYVISGDHHEIPLAIADLRGAFPPLRFGFHWLSDSYSSDRHRKGIQTAIRRACRRARPERQRAVPVAARSRLGVLQRHVPRVCHVHWLPGAERSVDGSVDRRHQRAPSDGAQRARCRARHQPGAVEHRGPIELRHLQATGRRIHRRTAIPVRLAADHATRRAAVFRVNHRLDAGDDGQGLRGHRGAAARTARRRRSDDCIAGQRIEAWRDAAADHAARRPSTSCESDSRGCTQERTACSVHAVPSRNRRSRQDATTCRCSAGVQRARSTGVSAPATLPRRCVPAARSGKHRHERAARRRSLVLVQREGSNDDDAHPSTNPRARIIRGETHSRRDGQSDSLDRI